MGRDFSVTYSGTALHDQKRQGACTHAGHPTEGGKAFQSVFDLDPSSITLDTQPGGVPAWDSMSAVASQARFLPRATAMILRMRPVFPGDRLEVSVDVLKIAGDIALVEGIVSVETTVVARASSVLRDVPWRCGQPDTPPRIAAL